MANRKPISHSTSDNPVPGGYIGPVWIDPAQDTIDGKIYVSQSGVVLGRTSTGAGAHEEILISSLGGGSGGGITSKTYAEMQALIAADGLTAGVFYLITDAAGTDLGFLTYAATTNTISVSGVGGYLNADFQAVGDYANTPTTFVAQQGIWSADNEGGYSEGDVVIWNLLHYQLTNAAAVDGTDPETNATAYTLLDKATYPETYVTAWDVSEFDFTNNWLQYRADLSGNLIRYSKSIDDQNFGYGFSIIPLFQWGRETWYGNVSIDGAIYQPNSPGLQVNGNTLSAGAFIADNNISGVHYLQGNIFESFSEYRYNTFSAASGFTGYRSNKHSAFSSFTNNSIADKNEVINNTIGLFAFITNLTISSSPGTNAAVSSNILENGAQLNGIAAGAGCAISRLKLAQGYTLTGYTLADGESITDLNYGQFPAMSEATRDALIAPAAGMQILNTDTSKMNFYTGSAWEEITSA